jgi:hypothetical protein
MTQIEALHQLFLSSQEYDIDDTTPTKAVVRQIACMIRTWAPPKEQARICHLAINEVADRLIRDFEVDESAD